MRFLVTSAPVAPFPHGGPVTVPTDLAGIFQVLPERKRLADDSPVLGAMCRAIAADMRLAGPLAETSQSNLWALPFVLFAAVQQVLWQDAAASACRLLPDARWHPSAGRGASRRVGRPGCHARPGRALLPRCRSCSIRMAVPWSPRTIRWTGRSRRSPLPPATSRVPRCAGGRGRCGPASIPRRAGAQGASQAGADRMRPGCRRGVTVAGRRPVASPSSVGAVLAGGVVCFACGFASGWWCWRVVRLLCMRIRIGPEWRPAGRTCSV